MTTEKGIVGVHLETNMRQNKNIMRLKRTGQGNVDENEQRIEELRRSQFYLSEGQQLAHTGNRAFNPSGFYDRWSRELFQIHGLDPVKRAPTLEEYLGTIHPQDRKFMARAIERMVAEGLGYDAKKRNVRHDSELRCVSIVGLPVGDNEPTKASSALPWM